MVVNFNLWCYNQIMTKTELHEKAKKLPIEPGIYLMKDHAGEVIYVGKAKNLRNRVKQYFDGREKQVKVSAMVDHVSAFDTVITKSEADAFALESNLIKKYKPKYNILLKDDKNFPYLALNKKETYPRFSVVRKVKPDGKTYFGPFVTYMRISTMLDILQSAYLLPTCKRCLEKPSKRACIEGDMGRCTMPCIRAVSKDEYAKQLAGAIDFLNGKTGGVKKVLSNRMKELAEKEDFENALIVRDQLELIKKAEERVLTNLPTSTDIDLFAFIEKPHNAVVVQFLRGGKMVGQEVISLEDKEGTQEELFSSVLAQFYQSKEEIPQQILLSQEVSNFEEYLKSNFGASANVLCPKRGVKKELIQNAILVAQKYLAQNRLRISLARKNSEGALDDLSEVLGLAKRPWRIECYDISNTYGTNSVASMVVFEGGVPAKKQYRKFKIKTIEGANDFGSMQEVMTRRFNEDESFGSFPDLVVIDGGLGQLHAAHKILQDLNVQTNIISLAKKEELIFTPQSNTPIALLRSEPALKLLQRIRDEAHRFAIGYHRKLRQKQMLK